MNKVKELERALMNFKLAIVKELRIECIVRWICKKINNIK